MTRYYCSGFDIHNAFGHGLGEMFKRELADTRSIVFIPGGVDKIEKAVTKHIPVFIEHFKNVGIQFDNIELITPDLSKHEAKEMIKNASFVMLMGGNPFKQKELCRKLDLLRELRNYNGVMLGFSAGGMLMSKYIIITPCSEEYPNFQIEQGLNLDNLSIYPHNNTAAPIYPETLVVENEIYQREDLVKAANEYGEFYLLQDHMRENGLTDVSIIKSSNGLLEYYTENEGKVWKVTKDGVKLQVAEDRRFHMTNTLFNEHFFHIEGDSLELRLINTYEEADGSLPFYWWDIILKPDNIAVGKISFRIGHNYHAYYNGNIGYEIDETYRGNHFALTACQLILQVALYHSMNKIYLTCDYDNIASSKTIEKLGAKLVEEVLPPKDYIYYYEGIPKHKIYELSLT